MSVQEVKREVLELLAEVRSAGRGASRTLLGDISDRRLPGLVAAHDAFEDARLSEDFRARLSRAVSTACAQARDGEVLPEQSSAPAVRPTQTWTVRLALAAAAILLGVLLYNVWAPKDQFVAPKGPSGTQSPVQKIPNAERDGPLVKQQPDKEHTNREDFRQPTPKRDGPVVQKEPNTDLPEKQKDERVAVVDKPVIGEFATASDTKVRVASGSPALTAKPGMKLALGSIIETGDAGAAQISLKDGSIMKLGFNTTLEARSQGASGFVASRDFVMRSGNLVATVAPTKEHRTFTIQTPVATARVLSTVFSLSLENVHPSTAAVKLRATLRVKSGRVAFFNEVDGVEVATMMESTAVAGNKPTEPKRLHTLRDFTIYYGGAHAHMRHETTQLNEQTAERRYVYPRGWAGFTVASMPNGRVRVAELFSDGPAQPAGLKVGDVIRFVDGVPVETPATVLRAIAWSRRRVISLEIDRGGQGQTFQVPTVFRGPHLPRMSAEFASRLYSATWLAMSGDPETSMRLLGELVNEGENAPAHNNLGVIFETRDAMPEAIRHYQAAVRLDKTDPLYRLNLAIALQKIGNFKRSIEEAREAVALDPRYREAIFFLADACALVDRFDDAIAVLDAASSRFPDVPRFWIRKSTVYIKEQKFTAAIQAADVAVQLDPTNYVTHVALGAALTYGGRYEDAIKSYLEAIELSPEEGSSYSAMADALDQLGRLDEAVAALRKAVELAPESAPIRNHLGQIFARQGFHGMAEKEYRESIRLDPLYVLARANLGPTLSSLGREREAEEVLLEVVRMEPTFAHAYGYLGVVYQRMGRYAEAERVLRKAIELEPDHAAGYFELGRLLVSRKALPEAELAYRRAVDLGLTDASVYMNLGMILFRKGLNAEAEPLLRKAIEADPKWLEPIDYLGLFYLAEKRYEDVVPLLRKAVELDPKRPDRQELLVEGLAYAGWSQIENHRWQAAVATLRECIERDAKRTYTLNCLNNIGFALTHLGEFDEAEKALGEALKLKPDDFEASSNLALLLANKGIRLDEALDRAQKAAQQPTAYEQTWYVLGVVHLKRGEFAAATEPLKRAVKGYGKVLLAADALVALGQAYEGTKDIALAKETYRRALKVEPVNRFAADALKRLGG
jgi:tetratricopeptide (TPR) repeat protein